MDSVNNRSLFRRKSQAARNKVREMGRVREPQGILAAFPELMMVAGRGRPMMQQPQPARFNQGGDIALEAYRQGLPEPTLSEQIAANPAFAGVTPVDITATPTPVDITATPTPRPAVEVPDIATMVRSELGDNPEAQEKFNELETALTDPETTNEERQAAITDAAGVENTREGLRAVVAQITGREQPASATVDELNRAITGVALGGAIGGPRSVAARISQALLTGLQAQRETAMGREALEAEIALAEMEARAKADPLSKLYGEGTSDLETKHFGSIPQFMPTLPGVLGGLEPIVAGEQDRIITTYNTLMDESDRLLRLSAEAQALLDTGNVAGFEGSASRFMSRATAALPDDVAAALGVDQENQRVSAAQRFDVIQRALAAQLAPMLLGESGRTISDADRRRVAEILGIAIEDKDGLGLNIRGLSGGAFRSEAELREAISEVQNILQRNRQEVEDEFSMLANRIPGLRVTRPEAPATTTQSGPAPIVLTEEDITRYGG